MKYSDVTKSKIFKKYAKENPLISITIILLGIVLCLFTGIDDQEAINLYIQKLQTLSEHNILNQQIAPLRNFYLQNNNKHPIKKYRHQLRKEFNRQRSSLKKEWQTKYNMSWPILILTKKGITKKLSFEAHHIIPINAGGINKWWNITPLSPKNHKLLHRSMEERACFSHDFLEEKYCRFILKIKIIYKHCLQPKITKSYEKSPSRAQNLYKKLVFI